MTISTPHSDLRACVVVPAKDEQELVGRCLQALAEQAGADARSYEVILVLDRCPDATARRGPGGRRPATRGCGCTCWRARDGAWARRAAWGWAPPVPASSALAAPHGLIACTDADSVADPLWLAVQLELAAAGATAIGGRIDILPEDLSRLSRRAREARALSGNRRRLLAGARDAGLADHGYFSGASMSLTADLYSDVGGLKPLVALEDEALEQALIQRGVPIVRPNAVRVETSGRVEGRAPRGLACELAAAL